jgi:hypothetical protein
LETSLRPIFEAGFSAGKSSFAKMVIGCSQLFKIRENAMSPSTSSKLIRSSSSSARDKPLVSIDQEEDENAYLLSQYRKRVYLC